MSDQLDALLASSARLRQIVEGLPADQLDAQAYPSKWTIAGVLSHIGSGAAITLRRIDDTAAGVETPADFAPSIWDLWNSKQPAAQASDALAADRALLDRIGSLTDEQRTTLRFSLGPMSVDADGLVGLRLNEHALHTWDIEVAIDPDATVPIDAANLVIDNLEMIARFTGKPTGTEHTVLVHTSDPTRDFAIALGAESVSLTPAEPASEPDLEMPAEAFIRLVYGRLDPDHTPTVRGDADLDELRGAFPGL